MRRDKIDPFEFKKLYDSLIIRNDVLCNGEHFTNKCQYHFGDTIEGIKKQIQFLDYSLDRVPKKDGNIELKYLEFHKWVSAELQFREGIIKYLERKKLKKLNIEKSRFTLRDWSRFIDFPFDVIVRDCKKRFSNNELEERILFLERYEGILRAIANEHVPCWGSDADNIRTEINRHKSILEKKHASPSNEQNEIINLGVENQAIQELQWHEVKITLLSEDTIKIEYRDFVKKYNYTEAGFKDNRKIDEPIGIWNLFFAFAYNNGTINWSTRRTHDSDPKKLVKRVSLFRKKLKELVVAEGSPISPYSKNKEYQTNFQITYHVNNNEL